ncbi:hypothetical protein U8V97_22540 [Priestia filamentosa]|uniref:hypothetical protein n=1 Tax=Priestia filamentosa TaxID=1402861 RepID=UPI003977F572
MNTKRRMITLDEETDQYLQDYMAEHKLRFSGEAIMDICQKYRAEKKKEWSLETISEIVSHNLHDVLRDELKNIRLGVKQSAQSLLYAGIHFKFDNDEGLKLGRQEGEIVVQLLRDQNNV